MSFPWIEESVLSRSPVGVFLFHQSSRLFIYESKRNWYLKKCFCSSSFIFSPGPPSSVRSNFSNIFSHRFDDLLNLSAMASRGPRTSPDSSSWREGPGARCRGENTGRPDKRGLRSCSCRQDKRLLQVFTDWTGEAAPSSCVGRPPNGSSAWTTSHLTLWFPNFLRRDHGWPPWPWQEQINPQNPRLHLLSSQKAIAPLMTTDWFLVRAAFDLRVFNAAATGTPESQNFTKSQTCWIFRLMIVVRTQIVTNGSIIQKKW